ncbi:cyclic nucleotide-binding domain-containing protein [Hydrogenophaga sp.]|uniref:cyclic nucleotide-binding domain-containing protein n=1 Tax=Hydrogenophaga sp. TaxID=1904254 RepID=UPI002728232C|nr:cyclic nucleotide-binding domain-containing protein [Hydrogenophaga sp.]MDO9435564.1 cyclic nucleotide-binding domain-containing protein [Hydrogenophaga sp.]
MALFDTLFGNRSAARQHKRHATVRRARVKASTTAQRAAQLLRSTHALIQLSKEEAFTVVGFMQMRQCADGEEIIRQGDRESSGDDGFMALVIEGEVTVETVTVSRTSPLTVNVLGPGHLMGEMSLMDGAARSATCTASTDVRCAVLTRTSLEAMIAEEPATAAKLLSAVALRLSQRLRETDGKLQLYGQLVQSMQEEINRLVPDPD